MPEICRFDGIHIIMWFADHNPPHFHAEYGEFVAEIHIRTLRVAKGHLPPRSMRRVLRWARENQSELLEAWDDVMAGRTPNRIAPPVR